MNDQDFIFGCRSGIQKAIRRGDFDLTFTCFNTLWSETAHRNWLMWRAPVLAAEDCWQMVPEVAQLVFSKSKEERDWRKLVYRLTFATKNRDTGLYFLKGKYDHPEMKELRAWKSMAREEKLGPDILAEAAAAAYTTPAKGVRELSEYEKAGIGLMVGRAKMGGMFADRQICTSTIMMTYLRGIAKEDIDADIKRNATHWKEVNQRSKPRVVNLPWYAFDPHTQAGKIADSIFMKHHAKKYNISYDEFGHLWFFAESAKYEKYLLKLDKLTNKKPDCFTSIWYLPILKEVLPFNGHNAKQSVNIWKEKIRADIKGCVEWILEKRER